MCYGSVTPSNVIDFLPFYIQSELGAEIKGIKLYVKTINRVYYFVFKDLFLILDFSSMDRRCWSNEDESAEVNSTPADDPQVPKQH